MYLKRFGKPGSSDYMVSAALADNLKASFTTGTKNVGAERGFYWGTDTDGVPHHHLEEFLTVLERNAAAAFRRVLDTGNRLTDDALPPWPPKPGVRMDIAWWLAAQILRTVRQRQRLELLEQKPVAIPSTFDSANRHIRYIAEMIEPLAANLFFRPWGIGFASACLLTGDVPVLVLNAQDHQDQDAAVGFWDVYMPLDPHRCLFLPGMIARDRNPRINRDHRFNAHGGLSIGLNSAMAEAAVRHVFFHSDHDPRKHLKQQDVIRRRGGDLPHFVLWHDALETDEGIERRWLDTHPSADEGRRGPANQTSNDEVVRMAQAMTDELDTAKEAFRRMTDGEL